MEIYNSTVHSRNLNDCLLTPRRHYESWNGSIGVDCGLLQIVTPLIIHYPDLGLPRIDTAIPIAGSDQIRSDRIADPCAFYLDLAFLWTGGSDVMFCDGDGSFGEWGVLLLESRAYGHCKLEESG